MTSTVWQGLFNSTPTIITVNSTRTQPFSTITHTNGTACNISFLRKPLSLSSPNAISNTELSLYLPITQSDTSPPHTSQSPGRSLFVWEKRPPPVVPHECWVGEKYGPQPNIFSILPLVFAFHFQVQYQTLESWQNAWGKTLSVGFEGYLKMHFSAFVASQSVSTAIRYNPPPLQNKSRFIPCHVMTLIQRYTEEAFSDLTLLSNNLSVPPKIWITTETCFITGHSNTTSVQHNAPSPCQPLILH